MSRKPVILNVSRFSKIMSHATQDKKIFQGNTHDRLSHTTHLGKQHGRQAGRFYYCDQCLTVVWILPFLGLCFAQRTKRGLDKAGGFNPNQHFFQTRNRLDLIMQLPKAGDKFFSTLTYWITSSHMYFVLDSRSVHFCPLTLFEATQYRLRWELVLVDAEFVLKFGVRTFFDSEQNSIH